MQSKLLFAVFLLSTTAVFSQKEKSIEGHIIVQNSKRKGIRVVNLNNEKETFTDAIGGFFILAKPDDLLIFSAEFVDYMRKIVDQEDFDKASIEVVMTSKVVQLDEVEIYENARINAVALGILSSPATQYTPAERRRQTATGLYPTLSAGMMAGGSIGLDPLMNWISGRTSLLKRALKAEEKEILLKKLEFYYSEDFFVEKLQIDSLYLGRFKNYAIYDSTLIEVLNSKSKPLITFNLYRIATEFKNLKDYEK